MDWIKKWISRKLFVAIGGVIVVIVYEQVSPESAEAVSGAINLLLAYIYGQSAVDLVEKLGIKDAITKRIAKKR